jgi:hypothetical protein
LERPDDPATSPGRGAWAHRASVAGTWREDTSTVKDSAYGPGGRTLKWLIIPFPLPDWGCQFAPVSLGEAR